MNDAPRWHDTHPPRRVKATRFTLSFEWVALFFTIAVAALAVVGSMHG